MISNKNFFEILNKKEFRDLKYLLDFGFLYLYEDDETDFISIYVMNERYRETVNNKHCVFYEVGEYAAYDGCVECDFDFEFRYFQTFDWEEGVNQHLYIDIDLVEAFERLQVISSKIYDRFGKF